MNFSKLRSLLISGLVVACSIGTVQAQTVTVNGASCPGATVTYGAGSIAISTSNCGVTVSPPVINASTPPIGTVNVIYATHTFTASGATPITWALSSGSLPAGLTLSSTGALAGTPTATGTFPFSVTASNSGGPSTALASSVTISPASGPPAIQLPAPAAVATVGVPYTFQYSSTGAQPVTYAATAGLPPGVTLTSTGLLSGTPTTGGVYNFTVTAANGTLPDATQAVTITVSTPVAPVISTATPPAGTQGTPYSFSFGVSAGTAPITWTVSSGTLPAGLTLAGSGLLSGTPTTPGTYMFAVQAANGTLPNAISTTYSVVIAAPPVGTGVPTVDINGVAITPAPPLPSKEAKKAGATHPAPSGGGNYPNGEIRAWSVAPARCGNTLPAITTLWYHNINFLDYGGQNAIDNIEFAPNQALAYGFVAPSIGTFTGYNGNIQIQTGTSGTPSPTFVTISETLCDFDVAKVATATACYTTAGAENGFGFQITNAPTTACKLVPGRQYYLNLRFQDARPAPLGTPTLDACTTQNASSCGAILRISITNAY
ncbi:MAG: putative Ig domain-containing protein [Betaproteobacteria bacterium]|nr:putative Ig domain-containing protein [Betaproteobacteria bacterium]